MIISNVLLLYSLGLHLRSAKSIYSFTEPDLFVRTSQVKVGHSGQLLLVVSLWGVGVGRGTPWEWGKGGNYAYKTFLFVCSLNSKDVYSGFGDQLSAIWNLAN